MKCFVSTCRLQSVENFGRMSDQTKHPPWVTKLPKLRPTMQCHVAPLRESNYETVRSEDKVVWLVGADLFLNVLCDILAVDKSVSIRDK
jgi:hypothetical protein